MSEIALDFEWARAPRYEIGSFRDLARFNSFKPKGKGEPRRPSKNWDEMGKRTQPDMAKFGVIVPEGKPRLFKPQSKILDGK